MSAVIELVTELVSLRTQRQDLSDRMTDLEDRLAEAMAEIGAWTVEVPGIGLVRRHGGKRRTVWQHEALFSILRQLAADASHRIVVADTGEIEGEGEAVMRHLRQCLQPAYWRSGALKSRGIDADEYAVVSYGRQTVELP